jgi:hypothetical protein
MLYGRPFLSNDLVTDPETDSLLKYTMDLWTFQQSNPKAGKKGSNCLNKRGKLQIEPGEQVLIKSWKEGAPADQLWPNWKGPYPVILAMPMAVTVQGIDSWIHLSRVNHATEESTCNQAQPRILASVSQ